MQWFVVHGESMYPMIKEHDLILVKKGDKKALKRGRVVIYKDREGRLIAHRLIKKRNGILYLRGDGFDYPVSKIKENKILGCAVGILRDGRYFPLLRSKELFYWFFSYPRRLLVNIRRNFLNVIKD